MTKNLLKLLAFTALSIIPAISIAQTSTSDFENLSLPAESYWDGSDSTGSFESGYVKFYNTYNHDWSLWESGFAYSNLTDSTTPGYTNLYSAITGSGYNSANYAVVQSGAKLMITQPGLTSVGMRVTNSTYAALSMRDGDAFSKKFGGVNGDDSDWFLLSITGWRNGNPINDTVNFYLADYRDSDPNMDYIVNDWRYVDLMPLYLKAPDSLTFLLTSSDTGAWGMNTPAFFCMDDFNIDVIWSVEQFKNADNVKVYPNPAQNHFILEAETTINNISVTDLTGRPVMKINSFGQNKVNVDISGLPAGMYGISFETAGGTGFKKMIKTQ
jgi:hypothetical protein